jgi:hypothetical protein
MGKNPNSGYGSGIQEKHSGSYFQEHTVRSKKYWIKNIKNFCCGFVPSGPESGIQNEKI